MAKSDIFIRISENPSLTHPESSRLQDYAACVKCAPELNVEVKLCSLNVFIWYGPIGFAPIFPDICYHLTHYKPAAADIPV
ncbi:hypothetical protein P4I29_14910, partial [Escherichia coli]|uniref:hypothetical protein n=1 Tax=Escherichia coli TaxID=562 RepID=UPI003CF90A1E